MNSSTRLMRLGVWLATTGLSFGAVIPAMAQPAPPPGAEQAGDQNVDPPTLAGRLATFQGAVSFHAAGETHWSAATLNYPVTTGEAFWTEPQAHATIEILDNRIVLAGSTELDIAALDQNTVSAVAAQGALFVELNSVEPGQIVTFNTPRGAVQLNAQGRYEIVAGDTNDATTVTVVEGAAHVSGANLSLDIGPQQTATIGGGDVFQGSVGQIQQDAFLQSMIRGAVRSHYAQGVPPQLQYMTGAADLQSYGTFAPNAQYGQVWYPTAVTRGWAPYRDGHWAFIHPWGWTWVDNARWGFAPFHYGRWVEINDRWGWVAGGGEVAAGSPIPVYSPALVSFVEVGGAAVAGAAIGFAGGGYAPAWIPLGPREPYYPWYHYRPDYFARVNRPYGVPQTVIQRGPTYVNNTTINNVRNITINRTDIFVNQRAATVAPAAAFARGQSLTAIARPLPVAALATARPLIGRLPVAPTAQTPNLPIASAQHYHVIVPEASVSPGDRGPRILPASMPSAQTHQAPALRQTALPPGIRAIPAASAPAPSPGRPKLPTGASPQTAPTGASPQTAPAATRVPGQVLPGPARPGARNPEKTSNPSSGLPGLHAPSSGSLAGEAARETGTEHPPAGPKVGARPGPTPSLSPRLPSHKLAAPLPPSDSGHPVVIKHLPPSAQPKGANGQEPAPMPRIIRPTPRPPVPAAPTGRPLEPKARHNEMAKPTPDADAPPASAPLARPSPHQTGAPQGQAPAHQSPVRQHQDPPKN